VRPGDRLPAFATTVDPAAMKTMAALLRDPNMIHLDPLVSEALGFGRRVVNQGPITMGYVHTMLVAFAGGADRVLATRFRFASAVFGGERVVAGGEVTAVHRDAVECAVWLDVDRPKGAVRALTGTARIAPPVRLMGP
jgi:3-hydroxybutyryl-CoA dehydratase